ncbi:MAG: hypothetical protein ACLR8P_14100 [Clostridium fessum]
MKLMKITASSMPHKMTPSQQMIIKKGYSPYIGDTGTWYVYDDNKKHLWTLASKRLAQQGTKGETRAQKEIHNEWCPGWQGGTRRKGENQEVKGKAPGAKGILTKRRS